ncbi:MAG: NUDIX hydrolase [bacterium]|nr:NUDIX hydrolase [bacterium]
MSDSSSPPPESRESQRTLPTKRMGSGAIMLDDARRVLLVNPTYKPGWEVPGGVVELNESPAAACQREVAEELGIDVDIGKLMCVDYNAATPDYVESLMFLFEVPALTPEQVASIRLKTSELSEFRFCTFDDARALLPDRIAQRVAAALNLDSGGCYLEDQQPIAE